MGNLLQLASSFPAVPLSHFPHLTHCLPHLGFFLLCVSVCVLSSNLMHTKSSPLAAKQKLMRAFPKRSSSWMLRLSSFTLIFPCKFKKTLTLTLTGGIFHPKQTNNFCRQRRPFEISKGWRRGGGGVLHISAGKRHALVFMFQSSAG